MEWAVDGSMVDSGGIRDRTGMARHARQDRRRRCGSGAVQGLLLTNHLPRGGLCACNFTEQYCSRVLGRARSLAFAGIESERWVGPVVHQRRGSASVSILDGQRVIRGALRRMPRGGVAHWAQPWRPSRRKTRIQVGWGRIKTNRQGRQRLRPCPECVRALCAHHQRLGCFDELDESEQLSPLRALEARRRCWERFRSIGGWRIMPTEPTKRQKRIVDSCLRLLLTIEESAALLSYKHGIELISHN